MAIAARATYLIRKLFSRRYLLVTNTVVCSTLMGLGDVIVQKREQYERADAGKLKHNWDRTGRLVVMGACTGPVNHYWYTMLDYVLPGRTLKIVLKKILLDQIIASPMFAFIFFMGTGVLEGRTSESCLNEFKRKFWTVYKADWTLWPAAQLINFFFLPPSLRVVYVAFVTLCWNTYLSYVKHKDVEEEIQVISR